ncbi:hypothetical protein [Sphingomonas sp.]|uniref:hypothetical protein n=1 Tax=Sphingomonas sp. TaxID=28214 RepID=UPI003B3B540E
MSTVSPEPLSVRSIVYFAYIGDESTPDEIARGRAAYMESQLQWLSGLIRVAGGRFRVIVPYVAPRRWDAVMHDLVGRYGFQVDPASIAAERVNSFEYRGFCALKALALASDPDHMIYYCHSKGITQLSPSKMGLFRFHTAIGLKADLDPLITGPNLSRATLFPSKFGWCFYNFFWIKSGYMAGLTVIPSADRYSFEALVGDPLDREGYRGVQALIDQVPASETGLVAKPWYRASETSSPELAATYGRYARMPLPGSDMSVS